MEILIFLLMMCGMIGFLAAVSLEPVRRFVHEAIASTGLIEFVFFVSIIVGVSFA